jgi:hypothetical protein
MAGEFSKPTYVRVGNTPVAVVSADFNQDGKADLAVANRDDNTISILLGNGDGTFQPAVNYGGATPDSLALGDFNNDGKVDLVVAGYGVVNLLMGNGDGSFHPIDPGITGERPVAADFNGDEKLDLAVIQDGYVLCGSYYEKAFVVYPGNGDGSFQSSVFTYCGRVFGYVPRDFNHDGKLDLVSLFDYLGDYANFGEYAGDGDGVFQNPIVLKLSSGPALSLAATDLNGDGNLDVIGATSVGTIAVALGQGDGTFSPSIEYSTGYQSTAGGLVAQDVNLDGSPDVVATGYNGVAVLLNKGDGTFAAGSDYVVYAVANSGGVAVSDFNGDGKPDIAIVGGTVKSAVAILLNLGSHPAVGLSAKSLQFGDQQVGTTSPPQKVTLTDTGTLRLDISSITVLGDFLEKNTCGNSVAIGASCTVAIQFRPRAEGLRKGKVSITDNAKPPAQVIQLTGLGVQ